MSASLAEKKEKFMPVLASLRKHPFLLALRRWGRFAFPPRETSPAAKREEKRMFSQVRFWLDKKVYFSPGNRTVIFSKDIRAGEASKCA